MLIKSITIKSGYILRELGGEFCLAYDGDKNNGALNSLPSINESGIFLWTKLEQNYSPVELIHALMEKNKMDYEEAQSDVEEFLAKLINAKIVEYTK